jgi:hypothetical protein
MRNRSNKAIYVAATGTLALLLTTSAFAEERHRDETWRHDRQNGETRTENRDDSNRNIVPRDTRNEQRDNSTHEQRDNNNRNYEQRDNNRNYEQHNNDRRGDNRGYDSRHNDYRDHRGSVSTHHESYRNGIPRSDGRVTMLGHISRYERERGGYRIWVGGSAYPYWVPESYFRSRRIGIGLDLRLGGIFRNGAVYVDVLGWPGDPYYNDPYYNDGYYGGSYGSYGNYDNGYIRGIVDGIDYRTQTLYVRDENSGRVVTVDMRRVDRRASRLDLGDLRRGDRVALNGEWIRGGLFAADRIDSIGAY